MWYQVPWETRLAVFFTAISGLLFINWLILSIGGSPTVSFFWATGTGLLMWWTQKDV